VEKALDVLMPLLEHEDETTRVLAALFLLKKKATQENLKVKEILDLKSNYQESEKMFAVTSSKDNKEKENE
jgi:hypothetical protein